jgi:hypothetical protein
MHESLFRAGARDGEPSRNPTGWNNPPLRAWRRDFRAALDVIGNEACTLHEHTPPMRRAECLARHLWHWAALGDADALKELLNRWQGRVPFALDVDVRRPPRDLTALSDGELAARAERLRELLNPPRQPSLSEVAADHPPDGGAVRVGD